MFKFVYERSVVSMSFLCDVLMVSNVLVVMVLEFVSFGCSWFACARWFVFHFAILCFL